MDQGSCLLVRAIKRPVIGSQQAEEVPSDRAPSARKPGSQRNNTTPVRIEIAKSGDMAYEFSTSELSFELKDSQKERLPTSVLRVWKKEASQWKIAAMFARPHYQDLPAR
jgi:ketosteroid isomerase-like protein